MLEDSVDYLVDSGVQAPLVLIVLIALEAVLSADNAIALAAIAKNLKDPKLQRQALNIGLIGAYILRISLIFAATWIVHFWQFELLGSIYLLWLVYNYFTQEKTDETEESDKQHHLSFASLWQIVPTIAITDLAFSLDSVTTAIAVSEDTWLIITGGTIGIITLRFLAGLFIRWLQEYTHLEDAGFITVGFVGLRLLSKVFLPDALISEWITILFIFVIFIWGFSERNPVKDK